MQLRSSDNRVYVCNIEILKFFDPEPQLINTKPLINNKLNVYLGDLKYRQFWS